MATTALGIRHSRMWEQYTRVTVLRDGPEQPRGHVPAYHYARTSPATRDVRSWKAWLIPVAAVVAAAVVAVLAVDPAYDWIWQDWGPR